MKKSIYILLLFILNVSSIIAQDWQWINFDDGKANDFPRNIVVEDKIYAVCARYNKDTLFGMTIFKMDTLGHILDSIEVVNENLYLTTYGILLGACSYDDIIYVYGTELNGQFTYLIKTDTNLVNYGIKYFTAPSYPDNFAATNLIATELGLYLIGPVQNSDLLGTIDAIIIHTDFDGNEKWRKIYGLAGVEDVPLSIIQVNKDMILIGGTRASPYNDIGANFYQRW
jgi:hypothetical protein